MGDRHHRVAVNALVRRCQNLFGFSARFKPKTRAAGAAHAQRVPTRAFGEIVLLPKEQHEHLIGPDGLGRAPRGRNDCVRIGAIGENRRVAA